MQPALSSQQQKAPAVFQPMSSGSLCICCSELIFHCWNNPVGRQNGDPESSCISGWQSGQEWILSAPDIEDVLQSPKLYVFFETRVPPWAGSRAELGHSDSKPSRATRSTAARRDPTAKGEMPFVLPMSECLWEPWARLVTSSEERTEPSAQALVPWSVCVWHVLLDPSP